MKIFLATAKLDDIRWASGNGMVDGVVTTPALTSVADPEADDRDILAEICRLTATPVWATPSAVSASDIYREGRELAKLSDQIVIQVPLVEDAVNAMRRLTADGVRVAATLVFNAAQALLAAKAGAAAVSTEIGRLEAHGQDAELVVAEIRDVFDAGAADCDIVAEMPTNAARFAACARAGADAVTLSPEILRTLLLHPLTDRGLDTLLHDLASHRARHARPRVAT
jgi:transaldolase